MLGSPVPYIVARGLHGSARGSALDLHLIRTRSSQNLPGSFPVLREICTGSHGIARTAHASRPYSPAVLPSRKSSRKSSRNSSRRLHGDPAGHARPASLPGVHAGHLWAARGSREIHSRLLGALTPGKPGFWKLTGRCRAAALFIYTKATALHLPVSFQN